MPPQAFAEITEAELQWFSWPRIPLGHITLLGGRGGSGKGLVAASLAASATRASSVFGNCQCPREGSALWIEEEDPIDSVVRPRLRAAGADLAQVWEDRARWFARSPQGVRQWLQEHNSRLVVLSPLLQALGIEKINDPQQVFRALHRLQETIEGLPCAVLGLVHTNKAQDLIAIERVLGSVTFTNFSRSVLLISTHNDEKRLVHAKCNVGMRADDRLFRVLADPADERSQAISIAWETPADGNCDADAVFDRVTASGGGSIGQWLRKFLEDCGGVERASVCLTAGETVGYTAAAIKAHRAEAGIESARASGPKTVWWWRLPGTAWPWAQSAKS